MNRTAARAIPHVIWQDTLALLAAVRVAVQTRRALPDVSVHVLVLIVRLGLPVFMAVCATERRRVAGRGMAIRAIKPAVWPRRDWERMIKHSTLPRRRRVAFRTIQREAGRSMVRVGCLLVIAKVAALTICRQGSN